MIESAAPGIDVRELAARVRARVSETRENPRNVPVDALTLRSSVFIDLLEAHTNIADQKQQIRTQWPSHIGNRFPFDLAPVRRLCLGALAFLFKDQRHVNAALVAAFRDQISFNRQLLDQVRSLRDEVDALTRMQTPAPAERTPIVERDR